MLVARELLNLIKTMVWEFRQGGEIAVPEGTIRAQYIAIVCMLRSVGHVLDKVDCIDQPEKGLLRDRWRIWKQERVFQTFIEPARNELLKEFKGGLRLRGNEDVEQFVFATPGAPGDATVAHAFESQTLRDASGRLVLPLFEDAIAFWDRCLNEIEGKRLTGKTIP